MSTIQFSALSSRIASGLLMLISMSAKAAEELVRWDRIDGILPISGQGGAACYHGSTVFLLEGVGHQRRPTSLALSGTSGAVKLVKGNIICNTTGEMLDTEAVPLSSKGDASFYGRLPYTLMCDDGSWVTL